MIARFLSLSVFAALAVACAKPATVAPTGGAGEAPPPAPAETAAAPDADPATREALDAAIAGAHRAPENRARDGARHPAETLLFFGLRKDMTVVELWPGGSGWYTEILAPTLREQGKLITTNFDTSGPADNYRVQSGQKFLAKLKATPAVYDRVEVVTVKDLNALTLAPEGTVDMVLTFRNTHNWVEDGVEAQVYGAAFRALKPGGILGVEQHRAAPGTKMDDPKKVAANGWLPEDWVIQRIESFGFKFVGKSEVNANPKDSRDYDKGVWALPPVLENGAKDRDKYVAIGESDRMTLRFVKP